jgi:hypothetical protein
LTSYYPRKADRRGRLSIAPKQSTFNLLPEIAYISRPILFLTKRDKTNLLEI